jgi:hypothetical protein
MSDCNLRRNILIEKAQEYSLALSMLNVDMLCRHHGCAYYDSNNHGIVLFFINPAYRLDNIIIVGLTILMRQKASQILVLQDNLYRFIKDRWGYTQEFSQQDYVDYIKKCHSYTMHCYELDGIL